MLTGIKIDNFRCFRSLEVELRPLTVLIGPNNTGKSVFLEAIRLLGKSRDLNPLDPWRRDESRKVRIVGLGKEFSNLHLESGRHQGKLATFRGEVLPGVAFFCLPSRGIESECEGFTDSQQEMPLGERGEKTAAVLDFLLRRDRKRFDGVVRVLRQLVPGLEELNIETPDPTRRHITVVLNGGLELPGESLSTGVRHLIFFATLAHHPRAPNVILVEEPEHGVHPKRLGDIVRLLRGIAKGECCNHPAQVILATHSPFLVDHLDLDQDQLLIFQREEGVEGACTAYPADKERLSTFLDEFMLGEVWYNESEEGLIGRGNQ